MRVLVTGATGFVGRMTLFHLSRGDKFDVTAVSKHISTDIPSLIGKYSTIDANDGRHTDFQRDKSQSNQSESPARDVDTKNDVMMSAESCDLADRKQVESLFEKVGQVDAVIHLAGQTFKKGLSDAHAYFDNNFRTTLNILECCRVYGVPSFVLSSSIAVYGVAQGQSTPDYLPVDERHPLRPFDFYDASKAHAEELLEFYCSRHGITGTVLRYSRIYGPGTDKGIVYGAARNAFANKPIEVFGDITSDFVYVEDVARANIAACVRRGGFEVFNVGSGEEVSLYNLCTSIIKFTGSQSQLLYNKEPHARFSLDITKARNQLAYEPTLLPEGLSKTISFIRQSYGRN